jgi:hypothetical protein
MKIKNKFEISKNYIGHVQLKYAFSNRNRETVPIKIPPGLPEFNRWQV